MENVNRCTADGCDRKIHGRGLCQRHYGQYRRNGRIRTDGGLQRTGIPVLILDVFTTHERPMPAGVVESIVVSHRPGTTEQSVNRALFRLRSLGYVEKTFHGHYGLDVWRITDRGRRAFDELTLEKGAA